MMSDDIEGEMLDDQIRRARIAREVLRPCEHCYAVPKILARDDYGYPKATGWTHEPGCPFYVAE